MKRNVAAVLAVTFVWIGCGAENPAADPLETQDDRPATVAALRAARGRWLASNLRDYTFTFQRSCFCPEDVRAAARITVRDGRIRSVLRLDTREAVPPELWERYHTVDDLFLRLLTAAGTAWEIRAGYDAVYGYPRDVYLDEVRLAIDEEQYFELRDLAPPIGPAD